MSISYNRDANGGTELMCRRLEQNIEQVLLDSIQIVASRVRTLEDNKPRIFWAHDLPGDPESEFLKTPSLRDRFHVFVFVSHWQMQAYIYHYGLPWERCRVIRNFIELDTPVETPFLQSPSEKIKLVYTPTPHRGLKLLVDVFQELQTDHEIELHCFSSFELYGQKQRDAEFKELFERIDSNPDIHNHGTQPNSVIREALRQMDIFAYPSIWPETSCLCLIEAMMTGLTCIHSSLAALPETSAGYTDMYQFTPDEALHKKAFKTRLEAALAEHPREKRDFFLMSRAVSFHSVNNVNDWRSLIDELLSNKGSLKLKLDEQKFIYRVDS